MPRFSAQLFKMHLLLLMMILPVFMVVTAGMPPCDPLTQYEMGGECCMKCAPGTYMTSQGTCSEPQCVNCGENEYQETYTIEPKCKRQPYCDPNKNFKVLDFKEKSKTERYDCQCAEGFHCSREGCLFCLRHKTCKPGERIQYKGNQTHDIVCQKCPEGTFIESSDGVCKKWKECESGYHIVTNGTVSSDNICAENSRGHLLVICVVVALVLVIASAVLVVWLCRGAAKEKDCVEACARVERPPPKEEPLIMFPTADPTSDVPETTILFSPEDIGSVPEENELQPSQTENGYTENGNVVRQENGKSHIFPRQESQTQTLSHESSSFCSDL
ncbi:tumor necrosis factor receptor superfamily member 5 isoform X2 [Scomber scombrus]|uniref:tumor necrosis factor receptor superfamily member 5 isoform X2 n=1 Tax=Scomber scombrus TaxID=13677 RepID=UPI002DDB5EA7|nr:tumor necrosis factor receptor superfamily member 5 isoform X2 [Scomber scombrus]